MYTLIGTAKLGKVDPQVLLADVLDRIDDLSQTLTHELRPWNWKAERQPGPGSLSRTPHSTAHG